MFLLRAIECLGNLSRRVERKSEFTMSPDTDRPICVWRSELIHARKSTYPFGTIHKWRPQKFLGVWSPVTVTNTQLITAITLLLGSPGGCHIWMVPWLFPLIVALLQSPRPKIDGRVFNRRFDAVKARADNGPAPRNQMGVSSYISHRKWARQILSLKW